MKKKRLTVLNLTGAEPLLDWQCKPKTQQIGRRLEGGATMLPPFIIDQIRRREEQQKRRREQQPTLELPLEPHPAQRQEDADEDDRDRGVLIVDLGR
jgi:hypothetical protein